MPSSRDASGAVEAARRLYRLRRLRDAEFGPELFGEPAWDLLLDLFIGRGQNRPLPPITANAAAVIPSAQAAPYITKLQECGLVETLCRGQSPSTSLVTLSDSGFERMTALLLGES